jgi:protein-tyrosine phosphatase
MGERAKVRTSVSHPLRVDWLEEPAKVGLTLAPGVRDRSSAGFRWARDLDADLAAIRRQGTTALVCLLEEHELERYGIGELFAKARSHDLEVLRLAIPDLGVPRDIEDVDRLLDHVNAHEANAGRVVIHCRGGLGRTGTIAGCYLVRKGMAPREALSMLRRVRSDRCPENDLQRSFIERYARHSASRAREPGAKALPTVTEAPPGWYASVLGGLRVVQQSATATDRASDVREVLAAAEREVRDAPDRCFEFSPTGDATLSAGGRTYRAGRFEIPSIAELRERIRARGRTGGGRLVLSVLWSDAKRSPIHPLLDIGTLQATAAPGTLFQAASQFNCLESTGPRVVPVTHYLGDSTQGPRASVSAFPGTLLRHYAAPAADGSRFVQRDDRCLDLLGDVFDASVAEVRSGYLQASNVRSMAALGDALEARFEQIRVGVHAGVEVVYGHDWSGPVPTPPPTIAQVFTSTIALGSYGPDDGSSHAATVRCQLLCAAYLGTLLAAVDLDCAAVVLTMIGGGVFHNPHRDIWDAIHWALAEVEPLATRTTQILVNTREPPHDADRAHVRARGGTVVRFGDDRVEVIA